MQAVDFIDKNMNLWPACEHLHPAVSSINNVTVRASCFIKIINHLNKNRMCIFVFLLAVIKTEP